MSYHRREAHAKWVKNMFNFQPNHNQNPTSYLGRNTTSKKLSLITKSMHYSLFRYLLGSNFKMNFITNQKATSIRRWGQVVNRRLKNLHFQPIHNQTPTSYLRRNTSP